MWASPSPSALTAPYNSFTNLLLRPDNFLWPPRHIGPMRKTIFAFGLAAGLATNLVAGDTLRLKLEPDRGFLLSGSPQEVVVKTAWKPTTCDCGRIRSSRTNTTLAPASRCSLSPGCIAIPNDLRTAPWGHWAKHKAVAIVPENWQSSPGKPGRS